MDIFKLYRVFWNWCFENPSKIKPTHIAIYSFAIEHCNRLGWKKEFGFPTTMVMEAIGVRSYSVYKNHLDELVDFGFLEMIEISKNQYSANIIALKENAKAPNKAPNKALDKALIKHLSKHTSKQVQSTYQSTRQSIDSIDIQGTNIQRTKNKEQVTKSQTSKNSIESIIEKFEVNKDMANVVFEWLEYKKERKETYKSDRSVKAFITKLRNLSGNDSVVAREIVEQSFANNYAGVFELKKQITNGKDRRDSETADRERQIMQLTREACMA